MTLIVPERWTSGLGTIAAQAEPAETKLHLVILRSGGKSHSNLYWLHGLGRAIRKARPDAIYVDEDPAGLASAQVAWFARRVGAGFVLMNIQNILKVYPPPFSFIQRFVFRRAAAAVCHTQQAVDVLRARGYEKRTFLMPFSTDVAPLSQEERDAVRNAHGMTHRTAGYVGRLVPEKGVDVFIRSIAEASDLHGVIIGNGPEREALENLAADLKLGERLRFLGTQPPDHAIRLLGALDVLALPSRTRANWAEQFGRVLIEAMASGVPVVATASGAIAEVVGDGGILVPESRDDLFSRALLEATEPARAKDLRERGLRRVAENYTPAIELQGLLAALSAASAKLEQAARTFSPSPASAQK
ncbi:MAG: glycosyltransferase [Candidatus Eremiobacteraeota bacterium]|nr:glycosyltransferase [Candidatus Eremiobacteraeota bacterium]